MLFALQAEGIQVVDGQQLMQAGARDQDAGRDHAAQHRVHDGRRRLRGALPGDAARDARERVRRARQQGALRHGLGVRRGRQRDLGRALQPAPARLHRPRAAPRRPRLLRHPAQLHGLPDVLLPHVRDRQRVARAGRRLQALPLLPRRGDRADPARARRRPRSSRSGRAPRSSASRTRRRPSRSSSATASASSIWEKPIFSRLVSLDHPEEIREGMVFALETFWPASDGWSAARIEEQLVVTKRRLRGHHALPGRGPA